MSVDRQPYRYLAEQSSRRELSLILGGLMLSLFLGALNQSIVNTAMPRIVVDLNGFETYAWIITAYMVTSTSVVPIVGKLGDVYGRKRFLIGGGAYFIVTTVLCGLAQDMPQLIFLRALQGVGGGVLMASAFAALAYVLPPMQRARMQGLFTGVFTLAGILGPLIGGYLTDNFSWRYVFFVNVPFGLAALLVLWRAYPESAPGGRRKPIDVAGALVLMAATVLLLLGLSWAGHGYAWTSPLILTLFAASFVALGLFIWLEQHAIDPVLPLGMFRNNRIAISAFGATAQSMGIFGAAVFLPLYVQGVLGTSATVSGSIIAPMTLTMLLGSIIAGQLIARTGRYKPFALSGFLVGTIGLVILGTLGTSATLVVLVLDMILLGFGLGFVGPTLTLTAQSASRPAELGVVTSLLQYARSMGNTLGTAIFGSVLTLRFVPEVQAALPPDISALLPVEVLVMAENPQALLDPGAAMALQTALAGSPALATALVAALRDGLAGALQWVFLGAAAVFGSGFVAVLFLREKPLVGRGELASDPVPSDLARTVRTGSPPALTA